MISSSLYLRLLILLLGGFLLIACDLVRSDSSGIEPNEIPYHTLFYSFQTETHQDYKSVVLENLSDAIKFLDTYFKEIPDDHPLLEVNYSDSLAVGVYTRARPNNSYFLQIDSLNSKGGLNILQVTETGSAYGGRQVVWPAHFIAVSKADFENRELLVEVKWKCETVPCVWQEFSGK